MEPLYYLIHRECRYVSGSATRRRWRAGGTERELFLSWGQWKLAGHGAVRKRREVGVRGWAKRWSGDQELIRLRSATAADPGNSDGVGPKALSVADKPPRSDNTLYNAANLNTIRVVRLESCSDKSVSLSVRAWTY